VSEALNLSRDSSVAASVSSRKLSELRRGVSLAIQPRQRRFPSKNQPSTQSNKPMNSITPTARSTILFAALVVSVWLGSCCIATAQAPVAQSDEITGDGQQIIQDDSSTTGTFQAVAVDASATSGVALQFDPSQANKPVAIQALDGGTVTSDGGTLAIGQDGKLSFSFQVTDQPGVHRVVVIDPNADDDSSHVIALVQFEVPSPAE
jgi:hypothetical protein